MPIFDYECLKCGKAYDVYHKTREEIEEIICPSCGSRKYKKLISLPIVSTSRRTVLNSSRSGETLDRGGCCGGGSCGCSSH